MAELDHTSAEYAQVADRYHQIEHEFRAHDGYAIEAQGGHGARRSWVPAQKTGTRQTEEFSGGWQMRIALAKLLLQKPNLLLLDEPTNHLDLESRNWLEEYLANIPYAFVLISHDRYFLDVTVNRIVEIWNKKIWTSTAATTKNICRRKLNARNNWKPRTKSERPHRATGSLHQSLPLPGDQGQASAEPDQRTGEDRAHRDSRKKKRPFTFPFRNPSPAAGSWPSSRTSRKSYGEKQVFKDVNFMIERGDRIALVGVNGAGKSTLIKLLAGIEPLTRGRIRARAQRSARLFCPGSIQGTRSRRAHSRRSRRSRAGIDAKPNCATCWAVFCFPGTMFSSASACSPAASATVTRCCKMLLHPANFLLLDEPTNHLDIRAKDVLLDALAKYTGTVVFVSHDRYFIDKLATRVFEIGDGKVEIYPGNYEDFLWRKQGGAAKLQAQLAKMSAHAQPPMESETGMRGASRPASQAHESHQAQTDGRSRSRN